MSLKTVKIVAISLLFLLAVGCRSRVQPVYEVRGAPVPSTSGVLSMSDVRRAIESAAYRRNWTVKNRGGNRLLAIYDRRKHHAEVMITFSPARFSMAHHKSSGLLFKNGRIHRTYNTWVHNLENDIRGELARTRARSRKKAVVPAVRRKTTPSSRKPSRSKSVVPN